TRIPFRRRRPRCKLSASPECRTISRAMITDRRRPDQTGPAARRRGSDEIVAPGAHARQYTGGGGVPAGRSERPICVVGSVAPPCDVQPLSRPSRRSFAASRLDLLERPAGAFRLLLA